MGLSWSGIVNTAKRIITVSEADVSKVVGLAGKGVNSAIKLFIKVEPVAITAIKPFFPEAVPLVSAAYSIAEKIETDLQAPGATKLAMATGIFTDAIVPATEAGLNAAGKTIDSEKVAAIAPALFNAIVAENNAQAEVAQVLSAAAASKALPDVTALAKAEADVATAVAAVKSAGATIQSAISSIVPAAQTPPAPPAA